MEKQLYGARAFLFDFDGTLVDSMPYWANAMLNVLDRNLIIYPENIIKIITPLGLEETARYFQRLGLDREIPEILGAIEGELTPMYEDVILAKPEVAKCLAELRSAGKKLAVLTASPHRWLDPCLARNRLTEYFDFVWSCEDFDTIKTDPKIYRDAAERLGVTLSEMTFLDDNLNADLAAMKAGCGVLGVFDESGVDAEQEIRRNTDGYLLDFGELRERVFANQ